MSDKYTLERGGIVVRRHADGLSFELIYPASSGKALNAPQLEDFEHDLENVRKLVAKLIELTDSFEGYRKKEP